MVFYLKLFMRSKLIIPSEPVFIKSINQAQKDSALNMMWHEIEKFVKDKKILEIDWSPYTTRWSDKKFLLENGFKIRKCVSNILNLTSSIEDLKAGLHKKHRNMIRKAEKMGMKVEESDDVNSYHKLSRDTYKRSGGEGPSYGMLKKLYDTLNPKGMCRIFFFTKYEDDILAAAFMLFCGERVYYYQGASAKKTFGASNLLHWEIIKKAKMEGYKMV